MFVFHYHCVYCFRGCNDSIFSAYKQGASSLMWTGVNLFFLASGFINGPQIFSQRLDGFVSRRCARILPLYLLFLLIGTIFWHLLDKHYFFYSDNYNLILPWLFLTGIDFIPRNLGPYYFSVSWSLSVEIQLYAITALLTVWPQRLIPLTCLLLLTLGIVLPYHSTEHFGHFGLVMHLDEFFIGVFLRQFFDKGLLSGLYKIKFHLLWISIPFVVKFYEIDFNIGNPFFDSLLLIFFSSMLLHLLKNSGLTCAPRLMIGRNCYFIYLFHMLVFMLTDELTQWIGFSFSNRLILTELSFVFCFLLSIASMKFFETPSKNFALQIMKSNR